MTPLHAIGEFFRSLALAVPMPLVRGLFVAVPVILILWVLLRRPDPDSDARQSRTLKLWSAAALAVQAVLYLFL